MIGGHAVGGLDRLGIGDPSRHRARIIGQDAGAQRPPRADMREIGTGEAVGGRAADRVAGRAATRQEEPKPLRSEEHTSELPSLMRNSYAVFCLKKKKYINIYNTHSHLSQTNDQHL